MDCEPKTLLLIEGDVPHAETVVQALRAAEGGRYQVDHVVSLNEGLDRLGVGDVDLVLLSLSIPGGLEPLRRIRDAQAGVPVVVLSGLDDEALAAQAVQEGAQDYLVKAHINTGVIVRVVRYALTRNRVLARLFELDRLRSEFVSTASHEMRTPLAIIREFVSLVSDGVAGPVTPQQAECLDSALRNCDRLTGLINDLLDLSRIESGRLKLFRVRSEIEPLVVQCHEDFLQRCQAKGQRLVLDPADDLPPVLCDREKILQVLVNLLGNAHKFNAEGSTITIRAKAMSDAVRIQIEDDGIGISRDDQRRIFDAFTQIGRQDGPGSQGTGLGLTISRNIVQLHGGTIAVESEPGRGSCFSFTIPLYVEGSEVDAFVKDRWRIYSGKDRTATLIALRARPRMLKLVHEVAGEILRGRRDEMLLEESGKLLLCLLESDRDGSVRVLERLRQSIEAAGIDPERVEYEFRELTPGGTGDPESDRETFTPLAALSRADERPNLVCIRS